MTPFEYLAVLISIVLGFGLTELLSGVQRLVRRRGRVRVHWLPVAWAVLVFIALVQWWWAAFGLRDRVDWTFFSFLLVLLVPMLLYQAASLVLPADGAAAGHDLRTHYFDTHPLLFGTLALATLLETVRAALVPDLQATLFNGAGTGLLLSLAVVRRERWHALGTVAVAGLFLVFIVLETLRIT